jgi:hypothetical protein
MNELVELAARFALNFAIIFIIIRCIYYPHQRNKDYVLTFFVFNTIIFFVMRLLNDTSLSIGVGFGLFAIFSILRYRTDTIPIRDMTYLFVLIALSVVNSLLMQAQAYMEFAVVNIILCVMLYVLEKGWGFKYEMRNTITYERIELIRKDRWGELLTDLQDRTGLPIKRIEIGHLNFLRDSARITIYCDADAIANAQVKLVQGSSDNDD